MKYNEPRDSAQAIRALTDWRQHSQPGDYAQAMWIPRPTARALYGSPLQPGRLFFLERLLNRGDFVIVQSFRRPLYLFAGDTLEAIAGAAS